MKADLHCHSSYSDGTFSPKELVDLAIAKQFDGLSITDHDSFESFFEAYSYAKEKGVILIPGIEISAQQGEESVHVLGYSFDPKNEAFSSFCAIHRRRREERNALMVKRVNDAGMPLTMEEVKDFFPGVISYGRPHIAGAMVKKGYVKNILAAFTQYIASGKPCYVAGDKWKVVEAIEAIHAAKGKAVLAHPNLLRKKSLINFLLSLPFDGIEGFYSAFPHAKMEQWCEEAKKRGWIITGGSDFHGEVRPDVPFGASYSPEESFKILYEHFLLHA